MFSDSNLYDQYNILIELLTGTNEKNGMPYRGYSISSEIYNDVNSFNEYISTINNITVQGSYELEEEYVEFTGTKTVDFMAVIFFSPSTNFQNIKETVSRIKTNNKSKFHLILIKKHFTSNVLNQLNELKSNFYKLEIVNLERLSINITKSQLVPIHESMKLEDIKRVKNDLKKNNMDFPRIHENDPALLWIKYNNVGSLVRVVRNSDQTLESIIYRVIIPSDENLI